MQKKHACTLEQQLRHSQSTSEQCIVLTTRPVAVLAQQAPPSQLHPSWLFSSSQESSSVYSGTPQGGTGSGSLHRHYKHKMHGINICHAEKHMHAHMNNNSVIRNRPRSSISYSELPQLLDSSHRHPNHILRCCVHRRNNDLPTMSHGSNRLVDEWCRG